MRGFKYSVTKAFSNQLRHQMQNGSSSGASGEGWAGFVKAVNGLAGYDEDAAIHSAPADNQPKVQSWLERLLNIALSIVALSWFLLVWSAVICVLGALIAIPIAILATGNFFLIFIVTCLILGACSHGK
jgi:hypothetical protein